MAPVQIVTEQEYMELFGTGSVGVMRYIGGIIDWTKEELQDMDRKTRNIMTLNIFAPRK